MPHLLLSVNLALRVKLGGEIEGRCKIVPDWLGRVLLRLCKVEIQIHIEYSGTNK